MPSKLSGSQDFNCSVIVFDSNAICHAGKDATKRLTLKGAKYAIIYSFIKGIISIVEDIGVDNVRIAFAWDSKDSIRKDLYPEYKANRRDRVLSDDEIILNASMWKQVDEIKASVLPELGLVNSFEQLGYEADDIIGSIALDSYDRLVIVSRDNDLYQLLDDKVSMYNAIDKNFFTRTNFVAKYGIEPNKWSTYKAIAGCPSDNIKGVKGIGEKTALHFLKGGVGLSEKKLYAIANATQEIEDTKLLVALPLLGVDSFEIKKNKSSVEKFRKVCERYNFMSLINQKYFDRWEAIFC